MGIICAVPPERPKSLECSSLRELYLSFADLFLRHGGIIRTGCSHSINVFDHHFFHMAKVGRNGTTRLHMPDEKEKIMACGDDFGDFEVDIARAKYLPSALETFVDPHEVWRENPKATNADWVYIREYDSKPYPFSIGLVTVREKSGLFVPVSSFPCKRGDLKRWRQGVKEYP
jgi:hypothetical protein